VAGIAGGAYAAGSGGGGAAGAGPGASADAGACQSEGGAVEAVIGSSQEGAAGFCGTAVAGSHDPAAGADAAAGVEGVTGFDGGGGIAAVAGREAPHFQQTSPAFFEPQLSQLHSSMRESPRPGRRPTGRVVAPCRIKATPR
jgi:hypothetical protein